MALLAGCVAPPDDEVVARIWVSDAAEVEALSAYDVWTEHVVDHVDVRLPRAALRGWPGAEIRVDDVGAAVEASRAGGGGAGFFDDWRPLDEVEDHLRQLARSADKVRVVELGRSVEDRPVLGLEIRTAPVDDRPGLLITGAQHAREWVAASSALWIADHLVTEAGVDPEVDALLAAYRVFVVPVMNPDGYEYTWTTDRLWRKNRRDNGDGTFGIDLNRNWDFAFGGPGSAGRTDSDNYRGPAPFSEPETDAVRRFVDDHPRYGVHVDLHCTGQIVLSPWGFTADPAPDAEVLEGGAADAAAAMGAVEGSRYDSGATNVALYPASGMAVDWTYGARGLDAWVVELRDEGRHGFLLPADELVPTALEAWAGVRALAAVPAARLGLVPQSDLVGGQDTTFLVSRSRRGADVSVWWTRGGDGETVTADGVVLELDRGQRLGGDRAGERGWARVRARVPPEWTGGRVRMQAEDGEGRTVPLTLDVY